ncbi:CASP-like protein 4B1 [Striga hermonthica]|uniref:CASP-like protein n=1 Tax=Striga hermonthica TaxID=68872 RepID=A0A9N7MBP7_STRHE|nr:CASP-like protein 4B1 [Striga hermonthica]
MSRLLGASERLGFQLSNGCFVWWEVSYIVRRWQREDLLQRSSLALRCSGMVFSLLAFVIMVGNKRDWRDFDKYEEYMYVVVTKNLYTEFQAFWQVYQLSTGRESQQHWHIHDDTPFLPFPSELNSWHAQGYDDYLVTEKPHFFFGLFESSCGLWSSPACMEFLSGNFGWAPPICCMGLQF